MKKTRKTVVGHHQKEEGGEEKGKWARERATVADLQSISRGGASFAFDKSRLKKEKEKGNQ